MNTRSDEELYALLGDDRKSAHAAFERIYQRHASRVYTYCRRIVLNEELARDILQETFVRLLAESRAGRQVTHVAAFILRVARNLCLNERRRRHNDSVPLEEFHLPPFHDNYESTEMVRLVEMALETLPADQREAFVLRESLSLTYNEIAELTGTSMPVIRTRLYRARIRLRELLAPILDERTGRQDSRLDDRRHG